MTTLKELMTQYYPLASLGGSTALVEAGHIYAGEPVTDEHRIGLQVGASVVEALSELGIEVSTMLFIDDYNGTGSVEETLRTYDPFLAEHGFFPGHIRLERDLVGKASEIIAKLTAQGRTVEKKGKISLKNGAAGLIMLAEIADGHIVRKYSCPLLDAALYVDKSEMTGGGILVSVLPKFYKEQQAKTKAIVRAVGCEAPILNVYFDKTGTIEADFDY